MVAVFVEWIILNASPVMAEVVRDAVDLLEVKVSLTDQDWLFKLQAGTVSLEHNNSASWVFVMTAIAEFKVKQTYRGVVETKAQ